MPTLAQYHFDTPGFAEFNQPPAAHTGYRERVLALSPRGYWRLGDAQGAQVIDHSPNQQHGTFIGDITHAQPGPLAFDDDPAVKLGPANGRIQLPPIPQHNAPNGMSVLAWVRASPTSTSQVLYSESTAGSNANFFSLLFDVTGVLAAFVAGSAGQELLLPTSTTIADDTWRFIAFVDHAGQAKWFVDGLPDQSANYTPTAKPSIDTVTAGALVWTTPTLHLRGWIDELAVFDQPLADADILDLHHAAVGRLETQ